MSALSDQYGQQLGQLLGLVAQAESQLADQAKRMKAQDARIADLEKDQVAGSESARAEHQALVDGNASIASAIQGMRDALENGSPAQPGPDIVPPAPGTGTAIPDAPTGGAGMASAQPENGATTPVAGGQSVVVDDGTGAPVGAVATTGPNPPSVVDVDGAPAPSAPDADDPTTGTGTGSTGTGIGSTDTGTSPIGSTDTTDTGSVGSSSTGTTGLGSNSTDPGSFGTGATTTGSDSTGSDSTVTGDNSDTVTGDNSVSGDGAGTRPGTTTNGG